MGVLKFLVYLGVTALNIFLTFVMLWHLAGTFDLEFIQEPTWRQFWGVSMVISLFTSPMLVSKGNREDDTEGIDKLLKNQVIVTISIGILYVFSLFLNWIL